ncbi:hypothetical protein MPSEU_000401600 [Mayamaea pseudoterrestris]|nr:hypothetical protein MPSEU_000401600 [Mayamaea pseudoterrestris]
MVMTMKLQVFLFVLLAALNPSTNALVSHAAVYKLSPFQSLSNQPWQTTTTSLCMQQHGGRRRRKRDLIRSWKPTRLQPEGSAQRRHSWQLGDAEQPPEEQSNEPDDAAASIDSSKNATTFLDHLNISKSAKHTLQLVGDKLKQFQVVLLSFCAGAFIAMTAILVPIYSQVETSSQPVTLFETILNDLQSAYVDEVDANKLFETGVSAMLRSLDPYTEFEGAQEASDMAESIEGKYAGVGLVISGTDAKTMEKVKSFQEKSSAGGSGSSKDVSMQTNDDGSTDEISSESDADDTDDKLRNVMAKAQERGIRVVSAFEGYAFDYGLRVGDKLVAVDDMPVGPDATVESVRNMLRGVPGTTVTIGFERVGVDGVQTISMPRTVVRTRDVKLATLVGDPKDGIGYVQLSGFTSDAGRQMRQAIAHLQRSAEDATNGKQSLQGIILDLRGNPGGLLTSAVDVASQLVPKGSDIVAARGRGFPGVIYRSRVDPILDPSTKLAVLVNGGTASAAEIVSGAVQDLDRGVIVGADRTFGKGLVQNVEELPFGTSLKFTVAKYYTPSGRCIQGITYKEGGGLGAEDAGYTETKVRENDRQTFYTKAGRIVKDGGGVEADYKVQAPKASALEVTLLRSGVLNDFAAEWCKNNELTGHQFKIDEDTYKSFQAFVNKKQQSGELELEAIYSKSLADLKRALKKSGYKGSEKGVEQLQANIVREIQKDFERYRSDIKEDITQSILARYVPESMLIERLIKTDEQVQATIKLLASDKKYDRIMAKGSSVERADGSGVSGSMAIANTPSEEEIKAGASIRW